MMPRRSDTHRRESSVGARNSPNTFYPQGSRRQEGAPIRIGALGRPFRSDDAQTWRVPLDSPNGTNGVTAVALRKRSETTA